MLPITLPSQHARHSCCLPDLLPSVLPPRLQPFGPVLPIIRVKDTQEAVEHVNANRLALQVRGVRWFGAIWLCTALPLPRCVLLLVPLCAAANPPVGCCKPSGRLLSGFFEGVE